MSQNSSVGNAKSAESERLNQLRGETKGVGSMSNVTSAVVGGDPKGLKKVEDYTTFLAEYAIDKGDFILHFFMTKDIHQWDRRDKYWLEVFPRVLSNAAQEYFQATIPRIFAEYVPEMTSWYMKCRGFGNRLDPETFLLGFLEKLDEALDEASKVLH